jgi:NAD(P)-dependent dehydrogenase (short-subunit alcohol dehydrogenase family)
MGADGASKVALVTGSARGLGLAVARHLRARGERVHVTWRSEGASARALRDEFGDRAHRADLLEPRDAAELVRSVLERDGRLDHAVHAVGEYVSGPLEAATLADLRRMLASNAESAFVFFAATRAALRAARGRAVFFGTSGLAGFRARRSTAAYAAAKSALVVLVKSWALEEAPHGVTVNLVSPGHVPHAHAHPDTLDEHRLASIPLGRPGTPEDVARAVAFLCSDEAAYTTGTELLVSGGWLL